MISQAFLNFGFPSAWMFLSSFGSIPCEIRTAAFFFSVICTANRVYPICKNPTVLSLCVWVQQAWFPKPGSHCFRCSTSQKTNYCMSLCVAAVFLHVFVLFRPVLSDDTFLFSPCNVQRHIYIYTHTYIYISILSMLKLETSCRCNGPVFYNPLAGTP